MDLDARTERHRILLASPAGAEAPCRDADLECIELGHGAVCFGDDLMGVTRGGQRGLGVAALRPDHAVPDIHRGAVLQGLRRVDPGDAGEVEHLAGEGDRELDDIGRAAAREHLDRLAHLERIADREPEGHVHRGDEGTRVDPRIEPDLHHRLSEQPRLRRVGHESTRPGLHVEHQSPGAFGDLLAHDARCDERDRLDRAGHIAQRIELLVGGGEARASRADDAAGGTQHFEHLIVREVRPPAADRLELVERAAGMAQAAAAELRHGSAARRDDRHEREGDLVADPAGRVLVDGRTLKRREVHPLARANHRVGPAHDLCLVHAIEEDRHREGGHLLLGNDASHIGIDHPVDLLGAQRAPITLGPDDVDGGVRLNHGGCGPLLDR
ncbi:unannotated protein [freshwater metagenome]|uniref:Unannotated protein n=1 Tax=freshwater metagenome TaxID=449393 RepID=A0A6J7LHX8_9ZZZZ